MNADAGWKSRKFILSTLFAVLIFGASCFLLIWAGHYTNAEWFTQRYWLYGTCVSVGVLCVGWGLISLDKLLTFAHALLPIIKAKYGIKDQ